MLKSYAAIYKQGHLDWLDDAPEQDNVRVIVTLVDSIPKIDQHKRGKFYNRRGAVLKSSLVLNKLTRILHKCVLNGNS
jgi:hypothetical protein